MDYLEKLNTEQKQAVLHLDGPVLVLAGAGSGKTRVVTTRIIHLIQSGISPRKILGLTFTNKAALEMKERVEALTSEKGVRISTFHSLGAMILRESIYWLNYTRNFAIYDESDAEKVIAQILEEKGIKTKKGEMKVWKSLISNAKNSLLEPEKVEADELPEGYQGLFPTVYKMYQERLKASDAVDFDDLLFLPVKLFQTSLEALNTYQNRWSHLLIDEYQDTNAAQYLFVRYLVEKSQNLFVVGDPDQAIYSWRGANIRNILQFEQDFKGAKIIRLEQNYRSSENILQAANALIQHNASRYEKELWSERGEGEKIKLYVGYNEKDEARFVANQIRAHIAKGIDYSEMVVFYRTNAQSRPFEDQFLSSDIPYSIVGGLSFYARKEIKDIMAYLRLIISDCDQIAFMRAIHEPKRGVGEASVDKILMAAQQEEIPVMEYLRKLLNKEPLNHSLNLSVKAKGGISDFLSLIAALREIALSGGVQDVIKAFIEKSGYMLYLKEDMETFEERKSNIAELLAKAYEWDSLTEDEGREKKNSLTHFLEEISLKSSLDEVAENKSFIRLMTVHNGKGLEFTVTFLVGLEEDLLPHVNSKDSLEQIEEERRLCYVGMTRAKHYLYLTHCRIRYLWGVERFQKPSRFLNEIPKHFLA